MGPTDEPDASLSIPVPATLSVVSCSSSQGTVVVGQGQIAIDLGPIADGGSATVTLVASPQAAAVGSLTMSAAAQGFNADLQPAQALATSIVTVGPPPTSLFPSRNRPHPFTRTSTPRTRSRSRTLSRSTHHERLGARPLPAGVNFVSATDSQGSAPVLQDGQISVLLGTIAAGQSATVTVFVNAPLAVPSGLALSASATAAPFDPNLSNNNATATMPVLPSDDLGVTLISLQNTAESGKNLSLAATVVNTGPSSASGVVLSFPLVDGARFISASPSTVSTSIQGGILLVQVGTLGVGASSTVTITIEPGQPGPTNYNASATGSTHDLDLANNQASDPIDVAASPGVLQFATASEVVNDTAGAAVISVTRTVGTSGAVAVHYQTAGGNAVSGLDYTPVSGTLSFASGQASQTIVVPILDNLHNSHDIDVGLILTSPTQGAVLGTQTANTIQIHDTDPDHTPPQITGLMWSGSAKSITSIVVSFSEPIQAAGALNSASYSLVDLGTSGLASPPSAQTRAIAFSPPTYNSTTESVTLVPTAPLSAGHFYRITVSGSGSSPLLDLAGNPLAGAGAGIAGSNYVALLGEGTTLKYDDSSGDLVTFRVTGGGYLDLTRAASGDGLVLTLEGGVAHKSVIAGTVVRARGKAGTTPLQTILGLGQFGDIRVKLSSPPFMISAPIRLR